MHGMIYDPWMGHYRSRVRRNLTVVPRGNSRRALASWAPASHKVASGVGVSPPCGAVSTRGVSFFVPGWPTPTTTNYYSYINTPQKKNTIKLRTALDCISSRAITIWYIRTESRQCQVLQEGDTDRLKSVDAQFATSVFFRSVLEMHHGLSFGVCNGP